MTGRPLTEDHSDTHPGAVDEATAWLIATPRATIPGAIVPAIRERFGLSAFQAIEALRRAQQRRSAGPFDEELVDKAAHFLIYGADRSSPAIVLAERFRLKLDDAFGLLREIERRSGRRFT